ERVEQVSIARRLDARLAQQAPPASRTGTAPRRRDCLEPRPRRTTSGGATFHRLAAIPTRDPWSNLEFAIADPHNPRVFIGHYAVAFAAKRIEPRASLGTYVLSALFLDLLWPVF